MFKTQNTTAQKWQKLFSIMNKVNKKG
jgi:hypothetical protein